MRIKSNKLTMRVDNLINNYGSYFLGTKWGYSLGYKNRGMVESRKDIYKRITE